jgi:Undecaprenyl-phosphate galactose phosphotransferase WbaP
VPEPSVTRRTPSGEVVPDEVAAALVDSATEGRLLAVRRAGRRRWAVVGETLLLSGSDAAGLFLAVTAAFWLWAGPVLGQPGAIYLEWLPLLPLVLLAYAEGGLYPGFGLGAVVILRTLSLRTSFVFITLAATTYALKLAHRHSRVTFALAWVLALVLVPLLRFALLGLTRRLAWWGEPAVVVGTGELAARTVDSLGGALSLGYRPVVALHVNGGTPPTAVAGVPVIGDVGLARAVAAAGVRVALVAWPGSGEGSQLVASLQGLYRHVVVVRDFEDLPVEGLEVRNLGRVFGVEFSNQLLRRRQRAVKRTVDLLLAAIGLVVALPLVLLGALAVVVASPGWPFFAHERVGPRGRRIRVWKLRTMVPDAERRLEALLASDDAAAAEWTRGHKLANDPRLIPVVGHLLRRFSIDELPQLANVLKGDMSLVGPRPFPPYHEQRFDAVFRRLRGEVRPGITGLWQVMVRSEGGLDEQQAYDSYYIRNWSIWMDLYLLGRTVAAVFSGRGAY